MPVKTLRRWLQALILESGVLAVVRQCCAPAAELALPQLPPLFRIFWMSVPCVEQARLLLRLLSPMSLLLILAMVAAATPTSPPTANKEDEQILTYIERLNDGRVDPRGAECLSCFLCSCSLRFFSMGQQCSIVLVVAVAAVATA